MASTRDIEAMYARLDTLDHFELLGVAREAPETDIKRAYVVAAKRWHVDAHAGSGLSPAVMSKLEAIFKRVGEAHETLSDPHARAEYETKLDREKQGLSTDVTAILRAESRIDAGLAHLRAKRWAEAEAAFAEATQLNKDDPLIWAHHAYARYRSEKAKRGPSAALEQVKPELERALKAQANLPEALHYLGVMHFEADDFAKAKRYLNRCLELDPKHLDATRLLRLAHSRAEKQKKRGGLGGLLDGLFKR